MKIVAAFLALVLAMGASPMDLGNIQSRSLPVLSEPSWTFSDAGNTYFIGKLSGNVIIVRSGDDPSPAPVPPPIPDENKPVPIVGAKWFSVIVDANKPEQQAWRTDAKLRKALSDRGIQFRSYTSEEADISTLGFQTIVGQTGMPCVIIQGETGNTLKSISPKTLDDVQKIAEVLK